MGFEPTELLRPTVFKTVALNHSATLPGGVTLTHVFENGTAERPVVVPFDSLVLADRANPPPSRVQEVVAALTKAQRDLMLLAALRAIRDQTQLCCHVSRPSGCHVVVLL